MSVLSLCLELCVIVGGLLLLSYAINTATRKYAKQIKQNPSPGALMESAVWYKDKQSNLWWRQHPGRLILFRDSLVLRDNQHEVFQIPISSLQIRYSGYVLGFIIGQSLPDSSTYSVRVSPSVFPSAGLSRSIGYRQWQQAITEVNQNVFHSTLGITPSLNTYINLGQIIFTVIFLIIFLIALATR